MKTEILKCTIHPKGAGEIELIATVEEMTALGITGINLVNESLRRHYTTHWRALRHTLNKIDALLSYKPNIMDAVILKTSSFTSEQFLALADATLEERGKLIKEFSAPAKKE